MRSLIFYFILCIVGILLFPIIGFAATVIPGGELAQSSILTVDGSPYIIQDYLYVPEGMVLEIEKDVVLKFEDGAGMIVYGNLDVQGEEAGRATFTSIYDDTVAGDTNQDGESEGSMFDDWIIAFLDNGTGDIRYADLKFGNGGIYSEGPLRISHTTFYETGGITLWGGNLSMSDSGMSVISETAIVGTNQSLILLTLTTIDTVSGLGSAGGIAVSHGSSVELEDVAMSNIDGTALSLFSESSVELKNVSISNAGGGVLAYDRSSVLGENMVMDSVENDCVLMYTLGTILKLSDSTISNCAGDGIIVYNNMNALLASTTIKNANTGIKAFGGAEISANNVTLEKNSIGAELFNGASLQLADSIVRQSDTGIALYSNASFLSERVQIINNDLGMFAFGNAVIAIHQSSFSENEFAVESHGITGQMDLTDNWWGDASGPYERLDNSDGLGNEILNLDEQPNVHYKPWLTSDPFIQSECCSSVFFLPGLEASRLYTQGVLLENKLWEPNRPADVEKLYLDSAGNSIVTGIYTRDVIDEAFGFNVYKNFSIFMDTLVSEGLISEWAKYPYDWRKDILEVVKYGTVIKNGDDFEIKHMIEELERVAANSKTGKVTVVGHSNGGLIGKLLVAELESMGKAELVDKLILVATPQLGTPEALFGLLHGDEQDMPKKFGIIVPKEQARTLGEYMKSAYGLLPSMEYFESVEAPVLVFATSTQHVGGYGLYGRVGTYAEMIEFVTAARDGRMDPAAHDTSTPNVLSSSMLQHARNLHEELDTWTPPEHLEVIEIAGWGIETWSGLEYYAVLDPNCDSNAVTCANQYVLKRRPIKTKEGDGTVVVESAAGINGEVYYVNLLKHNSQIGFLRRNRKHHDILEVGELQLLIKDIIFDRIEFIPSAVITKNTPMLIDVSNIEISIHSPVDINLIDKLGNYIGRVESEEEFVRIKEEIPNSSYYEIDGGKYISVPADQKYTLDLRGTGSGTFTLEIAEKTEGEEISKTVFVDIPVTPNLEASMFIEENRVAMLELDVDGDGKVDVVVEPSGGADSITQLEVLLAIIETSDLNIIAKKVMMLRINAVIKLIQKGKIKNPEEKVEKIMKQYAKFTEKLDKRSWKGDKLKQVIEQVMKLVDNLK